LRAIGAELAATSLVPTPPLSAVQARANGYVAARRRRRSALALSVVVGLAMTGVLKLGMGPGTDAVRMVGTPPGDPEPGTTTTTLMPPGLSGLDSHSSFFPWSGQNFDGDWAAIPTSKHCPAGPSNPQLPTIKILANEPARFVSPSPHDAVETLFNDFNKASSICGRAIELVERSFRAIPKDVVAVLGMPFDSNLDAALGEGRFLRENIPVIGGDGLSAVQHESPIAYPVGTSAAALTRTAVQHAWEGGARTFAVVHDDSQPFGNESAAALAAHVTRLGGTVKASVALPADAMVDAAKSELFNRACANNGCDFVFLALLPHTADNWLMTNPSGARIEMSALPTLLTSSFAESCFRGSNERCHGMTAWSGFIPPFGRHADNMEAAYAWNLARRDRGGSAMVEAAVVSGRVLLEALDSVRTNVTRESLRRALDEITVTSYVTSPLRWPRTTPRIGNPTTQAWRLVVPNTADTITAEMVVTTIDKVSRLQDPLPPREWHEVGTGWRTDPQ
jgi:hypothetical protein